MIDVNFYYPTLTAPYRGMPDKTLVSSTHYIFTNCNGNAHFTAIQSEIEAYGVLSDSFRDLVAIAINRGKTAIVEKDIARYALITATLNLGNSVTKIANGDIAILASSGMELRKKPRSIQLGEPSNLVIEAGNDGELSAKVDRVAGAKSYIVKYALDPQTPASHWAFVVISTRQYTITGLESGAKYWIMVGAVGAKGQTNWSVPQRSPYVP